MTSKTIELDNLQAGDDVVVDDIAGSGYQYVKMAYGADNTATIVTSTATNPFPVALSDIDNGVLDTINTAAEAVQTAVEGTLTVGSHAVTNAGTFAVQISDTSFAVADGNALGEGVLIQGDDGTDRKNINVDATTGDVQVDVTNTVTVDLGANNDVTLATLPDTAASDLASMSADLGTIDTDTGTIAGAVSGGQMQVDIVADGAGLLTTSAHDAAFGTAGTADAQVRSVQGIAGGTALPVSGTVTANPASGTIDTVTNLAQMGGVAITRGNGASGTGVQRVTIASDSTGQVKLAAGTAEIGKLAAGTAAIGKLAANSGVDIGDVDVLSSALPTGAATSANQLPATSGGISSVYRDEDIDETAVAAKASAGQVYWIHCVNLDATPVYLHFYDVAQGSVTVGTTGELMSFAVPSQGDANGAGFTMSFPHGVEFSTAITIACTTTISGTAGPGANEVILNVGYE